MARNYINHLVTSARVQQLKASNESGQLQDDDLSLLTQLNEIIPSASAPFSKADFNNKETVGSL